MIKVLTTCKNLNINKDEKRNKNVFIELLFLSFNDTFCGRLLNIYSSFIKYISNFRYWNIEFFAWQRKISRQFIYIVFILLTGAAGVKVNFYTSI